MSEILKILVPDPVHEINFAHSITSLNDGDDESEGKDPGRKRNSMGSSLVSKWHDSRSANYPNLVTLGQNIVNAKSSLGLTSTVNTAILKHRKALVM